jgi:hypothetical protein
MTFRVLALHQSLVRHPPLKFRKPCFASMSRRSKSCPLTRGNVQGYTFVALDHARPFVHVYWITKYPHTKIEHHWCTDRYPKPYLRSVLASPLSRGAEVMSISDLRPLALILEVIVSSARAWHRANGRRIIFWLLRKLWQLSMIMF